MKVIKRDGRTIDFDRTKIQTAIEKAKAAGLPNDNIKRAIEKGAGACASENYE